MMTPSGGVVSQLNITRSRVEDGGLISCTAIEGDSSIGHMARLNVYGNLYFLFYGHEVLGFKSCHRIPNVTEDSLSKINK